MNRIASSHPSSPDTKMQPVYSNVIDERVSFYLFTHHFFRFKPFAVRSSGAGAWAADALLVMEEQTR